MITENSIRVMNEFLLTILQEGSETLKYLKTVIHYVVSIDMTKFCVIYSFNF